MKKQSDSKEVNKEEPKVDLVIKGLTDAEAEEFMQWFSGQGEQDTGIWFAEAKYQGKKVRDCLTTDDAKSFPAVKYDKSEIELTNNVYTLYIKD